MVGRVLAAVLLAGLVACGGGAKDPAVGPTTHATRAPDGGGGGGGGQGGSGDARFTGPQRLAYSAAWMTCAMATPAQLNNQLGLGVESGLRSNPLAVAQAYSEQGIQRWARHAAFVGCLEGLQGQPNAP